MFIKLTAMNYNVNPVIAQRCYVNNDLSLKHLCIQLVFKFILQYFSYNKLIFLYLKTRRCKCYALNIMYILKIIMDNKLTKYTKT